MNLFYFLISVLLFNIIKAQFLKYTKTLETGSFNLANAYCNSLGKHILRIENEEENKELKGKFPVSTKIWIDYNDIQNELKLVNSENVPMNYSNFLPDSLKSNNRIKNCIIAEENNDGNWIWYQDDCYNINVIVCQNYKIKPYNIIITGESGSFEPAQSYCKSIGKHILRIESFAEIEKIYESLPADKEFWIDYNDVREERKWVNSDNVPMNSSLIPNLFNKLDWIDKNPDSFNIDDCAVISNLYKNKWKDISCHTISGIICQDYEEKKLTYTGKIGTYYDTLKECKSRGLTIIRINNERANEVAFNIISEYKEGNYWIDGSDEMKDGRWQFTDGEQLNYMNWAPNQPNKSRIVEHCIEVPLSMNGLWNAVSCDALNLIVCMMA